MTQDTIWITRAEPGASKSAKTWQRAGFIPIVAPLVEIAPPIEMPLPPAKKSKLIITSQNALRALANYTDRRDWDVICVGNATAGAALAMGFKTVKSAQGNAQDLIDFTCDKYDVSDGPFAYLSGSSVKTDIADILAQRNYQIARHVIYDNRAITTMPDINLSKVTHIALYSEMAAKALSRFRLDPTALTSVSISPAVDATIAPLKFATRHIATRPEEMAMIKALSS